MVWFAKTQTKNKRIFTFFVGTVSKMSKLSKMCRSLEIVIWQQIVAFSESFGNLSLHVSK